MKAPSHGPGTLAADASERNDVATGALVGDKDRNQELHWYLLLAGPQSCCITQ
jgi:hypothetical protein